MLSPTAAGPRLLPDVLYAIVYARVSTDEQVRRGFSIRQQLQRGREWCAENGYEVLEEIVDPGQSGATLERPGVDRIRDLVAAGGVGVVWAQDRDRLAREPAYLYLLGREFEEYGTKLRTDNDRDDDSPEGELTNGILDQLAKFERAKTAERSRRGKLRKAREGKIIATNKIKFGFAYNGTQDGYVVREEHMVTVRRVFRMVGAEGATLYGVKKALESDGIVPPNGGRYWNKKTLREMILHEVYKPLAADEIGALVSEGLMSAEVAPCLVEGERCGVWIFNQRRFTRTRARRPDGSYYWRQKTSPRPRHEWIAVPVPDSGVPREHVDAAREAIKDNVRPPDGGYRYWELAGLFVCGACGCRMSKTRHTKGRNYEGYYHYYFCPTRVNKGRDACPQLKGFRAEPIEEQVWELVRSLMLDPGYLLDDIERMIGEERAGAMRGDPEREADHWLETIAAAQRKRSGFQDMAAEGLISMDELREKLSELDDLRETAERELRAIEGRKDAVRRLEEDRDALVDHFAGMAPEALDALTREERHQLYTILRLRVTADADRNLTAEGMFGQLSVNSESRTCVIPLR